MWTVSERPFFDGVKIHWHHSGNLWCFSHPFPDHHYTDRRKTLKILNITKSYRLKDFKFSLLIFVLALTSLGIMVIGSAKHSVQGKQMIGLLIGLVALVIVSLIDYMWILNLQWVLYGLTIAMLLAVRFFGKMLTGRPGGLTLDSRRFSPQSLPRFFSTVFC